MKFNKYNKDQLVQAVLSSTSLAQVLSKLNLRVAGGNYDTLRKAIKLFGLDTSHFAGQSWSKGKFFEPKRSIQDYLSGKFTIQSNSLKLRLLKEGLLERKCYSCNLTEWQGHLIPIELHHIDGDKKNNFLSNLTILCPNCHSLTDNFRGKNINR